MVRQLFRTFGRKMESVNAKDYNLKEFGEKLQQFLIAHDYSSNRDVFEEIQLHHQIQVKYLRLDCQTQGSDY